MQPYQISPYNSPIPALPQRHVPVNNQRFFGGPFLPFALGGLAGLAISPFFYRPPYPCYGYPCGPRPYYGPYPYGGPGYGGSYYPGYY
ncbi:hypothetical protein [Pontibacillus litoralis]|uniref:hypothetical protein n=1 Tax=Pontibacillus litoralis TaxID=516703 RepID=UPI002FC2E84D